MRLLVVRHAIAEDREAFARSHKDDANRPLTSEGRNKMERAALGLRALVPELDVLAASPYKRAFDTAEIIASAYGDLAVERVPERSEGLLTAPAPGAARRIALTLLDAASAARERLTDANDAEALHDFRVAMRRLRSTLRAYQAQLDAVVPAKLRRRLRDLARATGEARDVEVQISWLERQRNELAPARPGSWPGSPSAATGRTRTSASGSLRSSTGWRVDYAERWEPPRRPTRRCRRRSRP